jgi:5'-phosphate synthase pdxT subunit
MVVGVLAFQGDFAEHIEVLSRMHVPSVEVRSRDDMSKVDALIIPGGESTVIAQFLAETGVGAEIQRRLKDLKHPLKVYGTCAGAIVLARKATGKNAPRTLGLIDAIIDRNAYGTQIDSFEAELKVSGIQKPVPVAFIRAPKITATGKGVEVLSRFRGEPVLIRQGKVMIGTFHAEVRASSDIHRLFIGSR